MHACILGPQMTPLQLAVLFSFIFGHRIGPRFNRCVCGVSSVCEVPSTSTSYQLIMMIRAFSLHNHGCLVFKKSTSFYVHWSHRKICIWPFFFLFSGIPLNKCLYTISYMLLTSAGSGLTFMALYVLVSSKRRYWQEINYLDPYIIIHIDMFNTHCR